MQSFRFPRWLEVALANLTVLGWKLGLVKKATDPAWLAAVAPSWCSLGWKRRYETAVEGLRAVREAVTQE